MKIGQLARATGLKVQTIRYYELHGLLPPHRRTEGGYRIFGPQDMEQLAFIKKAKVLGLSLGEIRDILSVQARKEPTCQHVRALLESKVAEVEEALKELEEFRTILVTLLAEAGELVDCRPAGGRICSIIEQAPEMVQPSSLDRFRPRRRRANRRE